MEKQDYGHADSYRVATKTEMKEKGPQKGRQGRRVAGQKPTEEVKKDVAQLKEEFGMDEHMIPLPELYNRLGIDPNAPGLEEDEVVEIYMKDGPNILTPPKTPTEAKKYLKIVFSGYNIIYWIAVFLCLIIFGTHATRVEQPDYEFLHLTSLLVVIILVSSIFTYFLRTKSSNMVRSLDNMAPRTADVYRGTEMTTYAEEVVVGDTVFLRPGSIVPADMRILYSEGLKVDNSALTGDPTPMLRSSVSSHDNPFETRNLAFASTVVVEGEGRGLVIATGDNTAIGKITKLAAEVGIEETPLDAELRLLFNTTVSACALLAGGLFLLLLIIGCEWNEGLTFVIGMLLANIPHGVPLLVTIGLLYTGKRIASRGCLPMNLDSVHALGKVNCIILDKSGPCTWGVPQTSHLWFDGKTFDADNTADQSATEYDPNNVTFRLLMRGACLSNNATFRPEDMDEPVFDRGVIGDAVGAAILRNVELAWGGGGGSVDYKNANPQVFELPYNSVNKFRVSVNELDGDARYVLTMTGAAERIIARCTQVFNNGGTVQMTESWKEKIERSNAELAELGEKVIGFADYLLPSDKYPRGFNFDMEGGNIPLGQLRFLGMMSFLDPPKPKVMDAITKARQAGIKVMLVTDDHPLTARAVAQKLGIISADSKTVEQLASIMGREPSEIKPRFAKANVVLGTNLAAMEKPQLESLLLAHTEIVFSRVTPMQKLDIVEACQRLGVVVAATGNCINDIPALKQADVGVGLGITGVDASKQAADVVLIDENFNSLVEGIEEGRYAFENIRKAVLYILCSNFPQIIAFAVYVFFQLPLPLGIMNLLLIDLVTDVLPSISLLRERPELNSMIPYVHGGLSIGDAESFELAYGQIGLLQAAAGSFVYFVMMAENGWWPQSLIGARNAWYSPGENDLPDRYNQEWTYTQRMSLERMVHSGVFLTIVACQIGAVLVCKTRRLSILSTSHANLLMWVGIVVAIVVVAFVNYIPVINRALNLGTVYYQPWIIPIPFVALIFVYEEFRKLYIRQLGTGNRILI